MDDNDKQSLHTTPLYAQPPEYFISQYSGWSESTRKKFKGELALEILRRDLRALTREDLWQIWNEIQKI